MPAMVSVSQPHTCPPTQFTGFSTASVRDISTPLELYTILLPLLSEKALKVLLYIILRTRGFDKTSDPISLTQMMHGIVTRDGQRLDHGTGLSKPSVIAGVEELEQRGAIVAERRNGETTCYRLCERLDLVRFADLPGSETQPGGVKDFNPHPDTIREREKEDSNPHARVCMHVDESTDASTPPAETSRPADAPAPDSASPASSAILPLAPALVVQVRAIAADLERDPARSQIQTAPQANAYAARALRLWQLSGVDEATFAACLDEAHQRTASRGGRIGVPMAYFFV